WKACKRSKRFSLDVKTPTQGSAFSCVAYGEDRITAKAARRPAALLNIQFTACRSALARDRVRSARKIYETLKIYDC
ncbi:hypothetical protein, partial [Pseudomonas viridiflava]|uniref:hypothetical protein n=1 Tax=Pseudomonas viridiflava TaxID=33069 RepID=UPI001980F934